MLEFLFSLLVAFSLGDMKAGKKINKAKCNEYYSSCSNPKKPDLDLLKCIRSLESYCKLTKRWQRNHPNREAYLIQLLRIEKYKKRKPNKSLKLAIEKCNSSLVWSYKTGKKKGTKKVFTRVGSGTFYNTTRDRYRYDYVKGFSTEKKCELHKIKHSKRALGDNCKQVYLGEDLSADIYFLEAMYRLKSATVNIPSQKTKAYFRTIEDCREASEIGFTIQRRGHPIKIGSIESENINSIISKCKKEKVVICSNGDTKPIMPDFAKR